MSRNRKTLMSQPAIMGIDPGEKGGVAWRDSTGVHCVPMPEDQDLAILLRKVASEVDLDNFVVVVEKAQAFPSQGVVSMFNYGKHAGIIEGMLLALHLRHILVIPQEWKRGILSGTTKDKQAAIEFCKKYFPEVSLRPGQKKRDHDGMADSLCIMEYGWRTYLKGEPCERENV